MGGNAVTNDRSRYWRSWYWIRACRALAEYAATIGLGILASYLILGGHW